MVRYQWEDVQNLLPSHADIRSRSQLKVIGLSLEFHVCSISPLPLERFLTLVSLGEMMCRTHNTTMPTQGHNGRSRVWALTFMSAPSPLPMEGFFSKNFCQMFGSIRWCAEPITQHARSRSQLKVTSLNLWFTVRSFTLEEFSLNFSQMFISVRLCKTYVSIKVKVIV